jgi:hypothetical protein
MSLSSQFHHRCNIETSVPDQRLKFKNGTATFTVGKDLDGAQSGARGTIKSLTLLSGSWSNGDAAGYLVLSDVQRVFNANESISDDGIVHGSAGTDGLATVNTDAYRKETVTTSTTVVKCRFSNHRATSFSESSGPHIKFDLSVMFPPSIVVVSGMKVEGLTAPYNHVYKIVGEPIAKYSDNKPHHITAYLGRVD